MPVVQELISHDELFFRLQEPPIIINTLKNSSEIERQQVEEMILTRYTSDMISLLPSCRCGAIKRQVSEKTVCSICGSIVKSHIEADIEPSVWFRQPAGVQKLISPIVLSMLIKRFKRSGFSLIHWLIDPNYAPTTRVSPVLQRLKEQGFPQSYNNFVTNFDSIMQFLFNIKPLAFPRGRIDYLKELILHHPDKIFSTHIPLPNKAILIVEKNSTGVYLDSVVAQAANAILTMVSIDKDFHDQRPKTKENRTAKALLRLSEFHDSYADKFEAGKTGQFRKHMAGTRVNFGFRAVITSVTGYHRHDELELPWGIGLAAWRHHLVAKLKQLGMDTNSAVGFIHGHIEKYNELLDTLLQQLCHESIRICKFSGQIRYGVAVCLQRNPSLLQGSQMLFYVPRFKTDPTDRTIGISTRVIKHCGGDYDGDQMNGSIALDMFMEDLWHPLKPYFNNVRMSTPLEITSDMAIPKTNVRAHATLLKM